MTSDSFLNLKYFLISNIKVCCSFWNSKWSTWILFIMIFHQSIFFNKRETSIAPIFMDLSFYWLSRYQIIHLSIERHWFSLRTLLLLFLFIDWFKPIFDFFRMFYYSIKGWIQLRFSRSEYNFICFEIIFRNIVIYIKRIIILILIIWSVWFRIVNHYNRMSFKICWRL